ncbi:uncharacterized protein LOC109720094 [Ananas comosus]|uniref:Uncharacterized protein LOC109720094 n=1 Tax=Ananas comosus TaxID=4615 RepID=A0A6P5G2H3_ANACO|nr:uncharacterized protein LOC109720094 [Ananas comosus]
MFNILSWNVRGLNDLVKRRCIRSVVSAYSRSVVCFQESKIDTVSRSFLRSCCGSSIDRCHFVPAIGASGGIITCWNSKVLSCSEALIRQHSLTLLLTHLGSGKSFYLTNVYGPPSWTGKDAFCSELTDLNHICSSNWIICGNFNFTKNQSERKGNRWSYKAMTMFADLINHLVMIDLPLSNQSFTWSNMQHQPSMAKLDRFLVSIQWDRSYPHCKVKALPKITSDHCPILLSTAILSAPRRFRFEKVWLTRDDFHSNMTLWWNKVPPKNSAILTFTAKLRHCRTRIKEWCKTNFHNISNTKRAIQDELQQIDLLEEQLNLPQLLNPDSLTTNFTIDEIKTATFQLAADKAPGPDGFSLTFFQTFWETIKEDIYNVFIDLQNDRLFSSPIDFSFVCLFPKKKGTRRATDFQPISLINGLQKIISKILANRLALTLPFIITSTQSAFLKDRLLTDSFTIASELVNWCSTSSNDCARLKADFQKAFDNVSWSFLERVLRWLGFNEKWWTWIKQCVCNAKIAILVNDTPTPWFKAQKGLRQGEPLPAYLFLLVVDCLARLTEAARDNNLLQGIGPSADTKTVLIQYADDTLFLCEPSKKILEKPTVYPENLRMGIWPQNQQLQIGVVLLGSASSKSKQTRQHHWMQSRLLPFCYLSLPLHTKRLRKNDRDLIINRVYTRIDGWKAKLLSYGGRLTIVNSVLTNLTLFYLSVFKAPKWVLLRIEALHRAFFWKGCSKISRGACLVNWKSICKSKRDGGLGILDLESMNAALLSKWWWRFFTEPQLSWCNLVKTLYYTRRSPLHEGTGFVPHSQWWKGVLRYRDVFRCSITHDLGDGRNIRLWTDIWIGEAPLSTVFPNLFAQTRNKNVKVSQSWSARGWRWRFLCRGFSDSTSSVSGRQLAQFKDHLIHNSPQNSPDKLKWRWTANQQFTVKSVYNFITDLGHRDPANIYIWRLKIPPKIKIFTWLLLRKRLPTADRLLICGLIVDEHCVFCASSTENCDHLFSNCVFIRFLLLSSAAGVIQSYTSGDVRDL